MKGFRLAVSMFVELTDVGLPLFRSALNNFSRVASWLLVTLIGKRVELNYFPRFTHVSNRTIAWSHLQRYQGKRGPAKPRQIHVSVILARLVSINPTAFVIIKLHVSIILVLLAIILFVLFVLLSLFD